MKKTKIGLGVFLAVALIGSFLFGTVHAQGVLPTIWEDVWFKLNVAVKGYERNLNGTPDWVPDNGKFTAFLHIRTGAGAYNDPDPLIQGDEWYAADLYYNDDTGPQIRYVPLNLINGTAPLDILIYSSWGTGSAASGTLESIRFMARLTGTMDKTGTFLQKGKFKSLAGSHTKLDPNPANPMYEGAGLTITGSLIIPFTFCKSTKNQQYPPCLLP